MLTLTNHPELRRFASMGSRRRVQHISFLSKLSLFQQLRSSKQVQRQFGSSALMRIRPSVTMGRQRSRSWQVLKAVNEGAMDSRQLRYYIEGTEQMSFTRGARLPPLRWPKTNFTPTQPMISIEMGNSHNAAPRTVPGSRVRNAFPSISDVQRNGVSLTATKAEDHMGCTFREIEMECRVRADSESRQ
jgi:hypothetical protein